MTPTPRNPDPYAMTPPTPRPMGSSPTSRKPVDPYSQAPMTPRPGEQDVFRSPIRGQDQFGQVPGIHHDPSFQQGQPRPQGPVAAPGQAMWPGQEGDPYMQPPGTPHPRGHQMPPPLDRQMSAPAPSTTVTTSKEDPFAFSGASDHPETATVTDPFAAPPATPGTQARPLRPPMHMPGQFPRPFRYQGMRLPTTPGDVFPHPQGAPRPRQEVPGQHPGLRPPETSAVSVQTILS